ncbi:hypothetical protein AB0F77_40310 [Streptomyces sp. NPDC026672]|uniref:hypothetical protein n=1 Tax=unclassified Streptomyces TaxID=2593676 RepID=UPI0033F81875
MRLSRSLAPATLAAVLVLCLPCEALAGTLTGDVEPAPDLFGSDCRTTVTGSHVVAYCHNPYVGTDRVSLHIECDHWWDLDTDGESVDAGPAMTVRLSGRCWSDVSSTWISHLRVD